MDGSGRFRKWSSIQGGYLALYFSIFFSLVEHVSNLVFLSVGLPFDEADKATGKKFASALVCGIERYPLKVTKGMSAKRIERRSRIKPFVKLVNLTHVMPTRYSLDADLKETVTTDLLKDPSKKKESRKAIKKILEEKYYCFDILDGLLTYF